MTSGVTILDSITCTRIVLFTYCDSDIGPMRVVRSRLVNIVFCKKGLNHNISFDFLGTC